MIEAKARELIKKYIYVCTWFELKEVDRSINAEQFEVVLNEIGQLEMELNKIGVSDAAIDKIIAFVKNLYPAGMPISNMADDQQLWLLKMIFGGKGDWLRETQI